MKVLLLSKSVFFCLIFVGSLWAEMNARPAADSCPSLLESKDTITPPCDLPAPANFQLLTPGSLPTVVLTWNPVLKADGYLVETFLQYPNYIDTQQVIIDTPTMALLIPQGAIPSFKVRGICIGGLFSQNYSYIPPVGTILLDLVLQAHLPQTMNLQSSDDGCYPAYYNPYVDYWFDVVKGPNGEGPFSRYSMYSYYDPNVPFNHERMRVAKINNFRPGLYTEPLGWNNNTTGQSGYLPPPVIPSENILIRTFEEGQYIDLFQITYNTPYYGNVCFIPLAGPGYSIKFYKGTAQNLRPKKADDRDATGDDSAGKSGFRVVNPFSDELRILPWQPDSDPVSIHLFGLDGRLILEQQFPARQEYNLPTAGLPSGFYLLRIDAGGIKHTYKVVKTQ